MPTYNIRFCTESNEFVRDEYGTDILPPVGAKLFIKTETQHRESEDVINANWYVVIDHLYMYKDFNVSWNGNSINNKFIKVVLKKIEVPKGFENEQ